MAEHAPPRVLRSKRLRAALYIAAGGKCERCGEEFGPDWEADHVLAWSIVQRTNVHELRATCRACNRKKGSMSFRAFQTAILRTAQDIATGDPRRLVVLDAYPGSGKSAAPVILATQLLGKNVDNRHIDHICWVVPRLSLQDQAMDSFLDSFWRTQLGHEYRIRKSTNDTNPSRNLAGHVTTYQAVAANNQLLVHELQRKNYVLILDEPHHAVEGGEYDLALRPLVERASVVLLMSGTLYRASRKEAIAFLPYTRSGDVRVPISVSDDRAVYIRYTLDQALAERALKHIEFELLDTTAEWRDRPGSPTVTSVDSLLGLERDQATDALFTALRTEFAHQLLQRAVQHWTAYQERHARAKLLVVAPRQSLARTYLKYLRGLGVKRVEIATADESEQARTNIDRFKKAPTESGALDALVTVAMAYEGLDVPSITHLACLTHIRSLGWITQMLARAQRVDRLDDRQPDMQRGFIFAPRDEFFNDVTSMIKQAQSLGAVHDPDDDEPPGPGGGGPPPEIVPVSSERSHQDVAVDTSDRSLTVDRLAYLRELMDRHNLQGISTMEFDAALREYEATRAERTAAATAAEAAEAKATARVAAAAVRRPNEEEDELRKAITDLAAQRDYALGIEFGATNQGLFRRFGKSRTDMTLEELRIVYDYLIKLRSDESKATSEIQ